MKFKENKKEIEEFMRSFSIVKGEPIEDVREVFKMIQDIKIAILPLLKHLESYNSKSPRLRYMAAACGQEMLLSCFPEEIKFMLLTDALRVLSEKERIIADAEKVRELGKKFKKCIFPDCDEDAIDGDCCKEHACKRCGKYQAVTADNLCEYCAEMLDNLK